MRTGRILGLLVGGLLVVAVLVMLSAWLFVDPNAYKEKITTLVKNATGRDLILNGDIKLSVFPWIALEMGPASLGNPPGFPDRPFVTLRHTAVRVKLLPLLQKRLEIARVELEGLDLRLLKNAAGKGNWEGFGESAGKGAPAATSGERALLQLPGVKVTNARMSYGAYALENFNLETAPFADGVVPIALRFDANRGIATEHLTVDSKVDLSSPAAGRYRFAAFTLLVQMSEAGNSRPIRWNLATPVLNLDLDAQTLAVPAFALVAAGAQLNGSLHGTHILDEPNVAGALTLAPLVVREFIPRLGMTAPQTRDPRALSQVAGSANFFYGGNTLRIDNLKIALDDTRLQGDVSIENLTSRSTKFNLSVDQIDVDRYLPPEGKQPTAVGPSVAPGPSSPPTPLSAEGTLAVGALRVSTIDLTNVRVTVVAKDGLAHLFPLQAQIYGGRYSGDITLDRRGATPSISVDEHMSAIDMGRLLARDGKKIRLSGKGNLDVKATGSGTGADGILRTLDGHLDAYVTGGAIEGVDLGFDLSRAEALIKREGAPAIQDTGRTKFDAFKTSAAINDGVAITKDLTLSSQVLRVTGQGSADLAKKDLNFQLLADTLRTSNGIPIQLPVKVTGTLADPTVRPDLEALAKGQLRQKLQDVLQDKLKGLFGKP
jgi:AsmA protein